MAQLKQTATEVRCRICSSTARAEVERLLGCLGDTDPVLGKITLAGIAALFEKMDGRQISTSALKRHRSLHASKIDAEAEESAEPAWMEDDDLQALIAEIGEMAAQPRVSPAALLNLQQRLYLLDLRRKLARGEKVAVTADAAARASALLVKGERDAAEGDLLGILGQAIGSVFSRPGAIRDAEPAGELVAGEAVEEAEVVEDVDEGGAGVVSTTEGGDFLR